MPPLNSKAPLLATRVLFYLALAVMLAAMSALGLCGCAAARGGKAVDMKIGPGAGALIGGGAAYASKNAGGGGGKAGAGGGDAEGGGAGAQADGNETGSGAGGDGADGGGSGDGESGDVPDSNKYSDSNADKGAEQAAADGASGGSGGAGGGEGDGAGGSGGADTDNGGETDGVGAGSAGSAFSLTQEELNALSSEKVEWGVRLNGRAQPQISGDTQKTLDKYDAIYIGNADKPLLYLTFDLGYENGYTDSILNTLKKRGVHAAFFITGHYLESQPDIVNRMIEEGHIVANHSLKHTSFPDDTDDELAADILGLEDAFRESTGKDLSKFIRPPSGEYSERSLALSADLGYTTVMWSFAYVDYDENQTVTIEYAYKKITENLHNGAIILLHTVNKENALALERVIVTAWDSGFIFSTLDKFLP